MTADRLPDIESVTGAALSGLDEHSLLQSLLDRVKKVLRVDTAAVLLLDAPAGSPLGTGFAARVAAPREPVILSTVDHTTVRNPLLVERGMRSLLGGSLSGRHSPFTH